ncbi:MAG: hypothetical protein AB7U82_32185 [Blastocatellales bacterium]
MKKVRSIRPINEVATTVVRELMRKSGGQWDFFIRHLPRMGMVESRLPNGPNISTAYQSE